MRGTEDGCLCVTAVGVYILSDGRLYVDNKQNGQSALAAREAREQ